jgi:hypothetical protein
MREETHRDWLPLAVFDGNRLRHECLFDIGQFRNRIGHSS